MWIIKQLLGVFIWDSFNGRCWDIFLLEPCVCSLSRNRKWPPAFLWESWGPLSVSCSLPRVNGYSRIPSFTRITTGILIHGQYVYFHNNYYFGAMFSISSLVLVFYFWAHTIINRLRICALKFIFWRIRVPATISFSHTKEFPCINPAFVLLPEVFWYRRLFLSTSHRVVNVVLSCLFAACCTTVSLQEPLLLAALLCHRKNFTARRTTSITHFGLILSSCPNAFSTCSLNTLTIVVK